MAVCALTGLRSIPSTPPSTCWYAVRGCVQLRPATALALQWGCLWYCQLAQPCADTTLVSRSRVTHTFLVDMRHGLVSVVEGK